MATDANGPICGCRDEGRNLVVCIDGTSNQFGETNTNVIELYNLIVKGKQQRTYYNSGVGTFAQSSWFSWTSWSQSIDNKLDQAVAKNFDQIILGAYRWLSEVYKGPKDKIYLFGFSRGAYQARCLAAMIRKVGLLHRGNEEQIPFAYELYSQDSRLADQFKETFCKSVDMIHFVGVWDTVSSVGVVRDKTLPLTTTNDHICFFRHALALDEERVKFLPEYVRGNNSAPEATVSEDDRPPRVKEVWFPGRHSDVGGGNHHNENLNIGGIALHWMAYEAVCCGLDLKPPTLNLDRYEDFFDKVPPSVTWKWWAMEYIPFTRLNYGSEGKDTTKRWPPNRSNGRIPVPGQKVFFTVLQKTQDGQMRPYTSRADFSKLSKRFKNWEDVVQQAYEVKDSTELLGDDWKDFIEPDPLLYFNTTAYTQEEWDDLTPLEKRKFLYGTKVCFSSPIARWALCDPWNVDLCLSGAASQIREVYLDAILKVHEESLPGASLKPLELGPQAKLVSSMWNMDLRDRLEPPRVIKNFPSSDFEWLLKVIKDKTVSEDIRVLCARTLSCTFATDLGCALMYLVRSHDFLLHLGAMHKHEQQWICERALKLVLGLFDRVPDVSLIQEAREDRQLTGDSPNSLKAWAATLAKQFAGKNNLRESTKQLDHLIAEEIMLKFLTNGKSCIPQRLDRNLTAHLSLDPSHTVICNVDITMTFSCPNTSCPRSTF